METVIIVTSSGVPVCKIILVEPNEKKTVGEKEKVPRTVTN